LLLCFDKFTLDTDRRELSSQSGVIHVEPQVFDLLLYLARHRARVISKDELIDNIWGGRIISDAALHSRINSARRTIGDTGKAQAFIRTIQRRGFLFTPETEVRTGEFSPLASAPPSPARTGPLNRPFIAVLPFNNLSDDPRLEYFADGVAEEIITGLSRVKELFVIARNSSFIYKGRSADVKMIGRDLGARYVVEGSVRKTGDRVRLTARLIAAETGVHLWADTYDRRLDDVFAVEDEIALKIVGASENSLREAEIRRVRLKRPDDLDHYELMLLIYAQVCLAQRDAAARAIPTLKRALEQSNNCATTHGLLAFCHENLFMMGGNKEEDRVGAIRHGRAALAHGRGDPTALALGAFALGMVEHDRAATVDTLESALALCPTSPFALFLGCRLLSYAGEAGKAIHWADRALQAGPFHRLSYIAHSARGLANFVQGQYEESARDLRRAIHANPNVGPLHGEMAAPLVKLGRVEAAQSAIRETLALQPSFRTQSFVDAVRPAPVVAETLAEAWLLAGLPS
jgi:TolB-like protein